jgi:hypothetical protein
MVSVSKCLSISLVKGICQFLQLISMDDLLFGDITEIEYHMIYNDLVIRPEIDILFKIDKVKPPFGPFSKTG